MFRDLKPFKNSIEEASYGCNFPVAEVCQKPRVKLSQYRSRGGRLCQSLFRRKNVRYTTVFVRKFATNQACILHSAYECRYGGRINAQLIADLLEHRARFAFEQPKNTKLRVADAECFPEGGVGTFE